MSLVVIVASLALGACASSGPKYAELGNAIPEIAAGYGRIYFYRDSSIVGAAIQPDIKLNGETVGSSVPGGFFFLDRPPGQYIVSTATEVENSITFSLDNGQTRYVRTYISFGILVGRVYPHLIERDQALVDISDLHYIGSPAQISPQDAGRPAIRQGAIGPVELDDLKDLLPEPR
ncbi:MAG: DUF2846 domain-containing protein [Burkholderiales bacterium]|nr:DUF2846 domain-containing protein [Burkholderiales bacterium]